jgi:hypothetical protein
LREALDLGVGTVIGLPCFALGVEPDCPQARTLSPGNIVTGMVADMYRRVGFDLSLA